MNVQTINVAEVTLALVQQLSDQLDIGQRGVVIERSENWDRATDSWIGVYRSRVTYVARAIGHGLGCRDQRVELVLLIRESGQESGAACEDALERLLQSVTSCLLNDQTLKGTVNVIDEMQVQYEEYYKKEDGFYCQEAAVLFTAVTRVV